MSRVHSRPSGNVLTCTGPAQFGDGIISMIDCTVKVDKKEDPKGDRVLLTFECVSISLPLRDGG